MKTPAKIREAAQWLIDQYGDAICYLGKYKGADTYYFRFPDDIATGFPYVYLMKADKVTEITGFEAVEIIGSFVENFSE